jgi:HSP20 family molecular chaperone IbpA
MKNDENNQPGHVHSLFDGINKFIDIVSDMVENDKEEVKVGGVIRPNSHKKIVGKYDVNIRFLDKKLGGLSDIRTFSDHKKEGPSSIEPVTDVFEDKGRILIVMELPGVRQEDIGLEIEGNSIEFIASGSGIRYAKKVWLPFAPREDSISSTFVNAIYTVEILKTE